MTGMNIGGMTDRNLIICEKCHTPKQHIVEIMGKERKVMCLCKCEMEKKEAEEEKRRRQESIDKVKRMRKVGFPDADMRRMTFDMDDDKDGRISQIARKYVEKFDDMQSSGKGLLLYGSVGTGKTFISACIANELISQGHPCLVTNFARLTNTISGMHEGKQEYMDSLDKFDLIVIDDLASERDTEYMGEMVQSIIDARYRAGKPLIVTTNLTSAELKRPSDIRKERIYSRLFEMCIPVEVIGKDRRKEKLKRDYVEFGDVLGF